MNSLNLNDNAVSLLASQADIVGRLAQNGGGFSAAVAAFESKDAEAFRWVLEQVEMLPYCELICEWVRVKRCALRCAEICAPPENTELPSLQQFADAVVRLSSNEKVARRVVDAIACGDASDYHAALNELELGEFCQLICYWVCSIGYNRVCEIVCGLQRATAFDPANDLTTAGSVIAGLVNNGKVLDAIGKAAIALDCETLQTTITEAGLAPGCQVICTLICVWRSVWVCRTLCEVRPPILTGAYAIEEAQRFALATRQLAGQPRVLADLVTAVQNRDAAAYGTIIKRFDLAPYCWQVCGWVSSVVCSEFCRCVCVPPGEVIPLFTAVGCYLVGPPTSDFNLNGTTVSGALAFTGTIPLIGLIPDGTAPQALKYRFTYQDYSGVSPNPNPVNLINGSMVPPTIIGTLEYQYWDGTAWMPGSTPFWVNNPGATATIPQHIGSPLSVSVDTDTDASGWIAVPRLNDNSQGATGLFTPAGAQGLILLDTTKITTETFDLTGAGILPKLTAGETVEPQALSQKPVYQINFEAQTVATSTPVSSNSLNAIALSNTTYSYIRHPEWPGTTPPPVTTAPLVLSVDILELDSEGGCAELDDVIHALYTAYHPYLGSCTVWLQGPDVATMTTPPGGSISLPIQPNQGQVIGTGNGAAVTFSGTLTIPVLPGSLRINAGAVVANDNGSGAISGAGISTGSINYATGAISVTFSTAPAVGVQVLVDYNTNDSSGTAGTPFDMTGLPPCGYILWLQATLNLTSGLACCGQVYGTFSDYIPFCTITPAGS